MKHEDYVYVQDPNGNPMMPTKRYRWVRHALRDGRAKVVKRIPFTIRLQYRPKTQVVQPVVLGMDPGRTNIGLAAVTEDGTCLYRSQCETRNKQIPKLMQERLSHRRASRHGERKRRQRRAARYQTEFAEKIRDRHLNGYGEDGVIHLHGIKNTESRFLNRIRPKGWLTPTALQLLRTHENLIQLVTQILPISRMVVEINRFAFLELDHPELKHWEIDFQRGALYQKGNVYDAVSIQQDGTCLLCKKKAIAHYHHIIPRSKRGSNTIGNLAGLCRICHTKVHTDEKAANKLSSRKSGMNKKYGALSVLNQIIPYLANILEKQYPGKTAFTTGQETKIFRDHAGIKKDHDLDAYCIACSLLDADNIAVAAVPSERGDYYQIRQFRNHDRALINRQTERTYFNGKEKVATNRRKRMDQKVDSLHEWYEKVKCMYGKRKARQLQTQLTVRKSQRSYNAKNRMLPGTVFYYYGERHVMQGQLTNGKYVYDINDKTRRFPTKDCTWRSHHGLVYVS